MKDLTTRNENYAKWFQELVISGNFQQFPLRVFCRFSAVILR